MADTIHTFRLQWKMGLQVENDFLGFWNVKICENRGNFVFPYLPYSVHAE